VKLPYDPEIPLLRIYPREINPVCWKNNYILMDTGLVIINNS
jgi:hypothetical protein